MSIKPVDFQVMIPRTMEISKSSSNETQKNYTMQQQQAASTQNNAENTLRQVYSQKHAQDVRITQRQKDKESSEKDRKKKEEEKNESSESKAQIKSMQTSTIDIKV